MSSDFDFNESLGAQEEDLARMHRASRRRNMLIWSLAVLSLLFGIVCLYLAMDNASLAASNRTYGMTQQQEKQSLAEEFDAACKSADFPASPVGSNICRKAQQVASEPGAAVTGPQGVQGAQGPRGERGYPGLLGPVGPKGDKGDAGPQGLAGLLGAMGMAGQDGMSGTDGPPGPSGPSGPPGPMGPAGPTGPPGPSGADSSATGPPGPAGPAGADGEDGSTGPQGAEGRGIRTASCGDDGRWKITYTDGHVADAGQCRAVAGPPIIGAP